MVEKLRINSITITETFNQRFTSFRTGMIQMIKDSVLLMTIILLATQTLPLYYPPTHDISHT